MFYNTKVAFNFGIQLPVKEKMRLARIFSNYYFLKERPYPLNRMISNKDMLQKTKRRIKITLYI